jgi:ion channel-forming bestrophin family protein
MQRAMRVLALLAGMTLYSLVEVGAFAPLQAKVLSTHSVNKDPSPSSTTGSMLQMIKYLPVEDNGALSYGERSRPYRRDVFDHDEWVRVRSNTRFANNLLTIFESGVVRQLLREVILTTGVATFICAYNALLVKGYDDFAGIHHDPLVQGFYVFSLPGVFFTLTSPALSLLLGTYSPFPLN